MGDLWATAAIGTAVVNSPLAGHMENAYNAVFPDPWKQLQPYLSKHPVSGKLVLDEDKLGEKEKKKVYELLDKMKAKYTPKE